MIHVLFEWPFKQEEGEQSAEGYIVKETQSKTSATISSREGQELPSSSSRSLQVIPQRAPILYRPYRPSYRFLIMSGCALAALMLVIGVLLSQQMNTPVEVTLVPKTWVITKSLTISTSPGKGELAAQTLSGQSSQIKQAVLASQIIHHPATIAHGVLLLYNQTPTTVTIPAGKIIPSTDGLHTIVTDQAATLPPDTNGDQPIMGSASTLAHTIETGKASNIAANVFRNACSPCGVGIIMQNTPFTGGQDESYVPLLRQQDIDKSVNPLLPTLEAQAQADLTTHLSDNQALLAGSITCTPQIHTDAAAGSNVSSTQATVAERCTATIFAKDAVRALLTPDYRGPGQLEPLGPLSFEEAAPVLPNAGTFRISLKTSQSWTIFFSSNQLSLCAQMMIGKNAQEAQVIIFQQLGVRNVTFSSQTLPGTPDLIHWQIQGGLTHTTTSHSTVIQQFQIRQEPLGLKT